MKGAFSLIAASLFLGLVLYAGPVPAAPPDAGQILNQQRRPGDRLPDRLPRDDQKEAVRPPMKDTGTKVLVRKFRFSGQQGLATEAELQVLLSESVGKELGLTELQLLAERITAFLRHQKGYLLARAYLPAQEIVDGIVEIAVIAGKIDGAPSIRVREPRRISQHLLEKIAEKAIPRESALRMENLERGVLLINDLPGISSHASLEPGTASGSTRVGIDVVEGPLLRGMISGDNYGDRYTGAWRGIAQATAADPFGFGDQMNLGIMAAEHMVQGSAAYALPVGATGLNWSVSYTGLQYELGKDLASLDAEGRADNVATSLTYPLLRSRKKSFWTGLGFEYIRLEDEAAGAPTSERHLSVGNATLFGNFLDTFGGGGMINAGLTVYYGNLDLEDIAGAQARDDAGPRSAGSFFRATYSLARLQRLTRSISLFGAIRGQFAGGNLDSSQTFILGGPTGVRAYPVGEASGDEGHALTFETRFDLPVAPAGNSVQLVGFIDTGWVRQHKDPWTGSVTNATGRNDYWLSGGGLGVVIDKAGRYSIRAAYAHKIGDNPGRSTAGNDADNLDNDGRFWLQTVIWF